MELVNRGRQSFFIPAERENSGITNFNKWEQAFRVFMNIFTKEYPDRVTELIQYNHIIFTAAASYQWDNVYTYDKEFRAHMSNFPSRSWAVILQQAWTMYIKDRIRHNDQNAGRNGFGFGGNKRRKEECRHFNKGKCTAGLGCRYDQCCLECGKFGHGALICCRKLNKADGTPVTVTVHNANLSQSGSNQAVTK